MYGAAPVHCLLAHRLRPRAGSTNPTPMKPTPKREPCPPHYPSRSLSTTSLDRTHILPTLTPSHPEPTPRTHTTPPHTTTHRHTPHHPNRSKQGLRDVVLSKEKLDFAKRLQATPAEMRVSRTAAPPQFPCPRCRPFHTPLVSCARHPANMLRDMDVHELRSSAHPRTSLALFCIYFEARRKRARLPMWRGGRTAGVERGRGWMVWCTRAVESSGEQEPQGLKRRS